MSKYPYLSKAPIEEALIEIRIAPSASSTLQSIQALHESLKANYPKIEEINSFQGQLKFDKQQGLSTLSNQQLIGYKFTSTDGKNIVQAKIDGFIYSRLKPFPNQEEQRNEAKVLWREYLFKLKPKSIFRMGVRYINVLDIPKGKLLATFLKVPLPIPPLTREVSLDSFLSRAIIDGPEGIKAIITLTSKDSDPASSEGKIILDIDSIFSGEIPLEEDGLWNIEKRLTDFEHEIFFASVSETTWRRYL